MPKIQTIVRLRPQIPQNQQVTIQGKEVKIDLDGQIKQFIFDDVFDHEATQGSIFQALDIKQKIDLFMKGFSQTIFAYGQTGSGKTYTMEGSSEDPGLIPRLIESLFTHEDHQKNDITVSFLQIYQEKVLDMLNFKVDGGLKLKYRNDEFQVQNLNTIACSSATQMMNCYRKGCKSKMMAQHMLNESSSRSHCIFTICLTQTNVITQESIISNFHLVDLAGSERVSQTLAKGQQFLESTEINKSLFALRQVISQLAKKDSKLTSILKNSLQGKSYVLMVFYDNNDQKIVCISSVQENLSQTLQSLNYGSKARTITISPIICKDQKSQQIESLRLEVANLQTQLKSAYQQIDMQSKLIEKLSTSTQEKQLPPLTEKIKQNNFLGEKQQNQQKQLQQTIQTQKDQFVAQIESQNQLIQKLISNEQTLQHTNQEMKTQMLYNATEIQNIVDENQDQREKIIIFEEIIYKDIQNSKENDSFQKDWRELFKQNDTQNSLIDTITNLILNYKQSIQKLQEKIQTFGSEFCASKNEQHRTNQTPKYLHPYTANRPKRSLTVDKKRFINNYT